MVNPVIEFRAQLFWKTPEIFAGEKQVQPGPKTRPVYLPAGTGWLDFWTGRTLAGGRTIEADAAIDTLPLLVRAGSIVPMGPFLQYASEKPADPLEVRIYPGANGKFTLYEDEGDNYDYEKGIHSSFAFDWDDARRRLTVGERVGSCPGMLKDRTFHIVIVRENHGTGVDVTAQPDKVVSYRGEGEEVDF